MKCPFCQSRAVHKHTAASGTPESFICLTCQRTFRCPKSIGFRLGLLSLGMLFLFPILLNLPIKILAYLLPRGQAESAEVVIILGRGPNKLADRAVTAAHLFHEEPIDIFVSGMTDAPQIIKTLKEMGVPETSLSGERCSQTTWENALFSEILLDSTNNQHIVLITDDPHIVRAYLVFKGFGFDVTPHVVSSDNIVSWFSASRTRQAFREYVALINYAVTGKFDFEGKSEQQAYAAEARQKIADWNCDL